MRALNSAIDAGEVGTGRRRRSSQEAFDAVRPVLGVRRLRRAEDAQPPVPVEEIEQLIEDRARRPPPPRLRRRRPHPPGPRGARRAPRRHRGAARAGSGSRSAGRQACQSMDAPDIKTPLPGPEGQGDHRARRDGRVAVLHARLSARHRARRRAPSVEDVDGNVFLDCAAGIAVNSTGHSHPDVVQAITEQAQKFLHMSGTDFYYEPQVRLAEELAAHRADSRAACGRSSATPAPRRSRRALKLARYATGRQNIIAFFGAFHGRTHGIAVADREQGDSAARLRAAAAGRVSRAVSRLLSAARSGSTPETLRGRVPRLHRAPAVRATRVARRSRRRSSSSRFRARAATSSRPTSSCSGCAS